MKLTLSAGLCALLFAGASLIGGYTQAAGPPADVITSAVADPTRPQSVLARSAVDDRLQRAGGRQDVVDVTFVKVDEPGGRYIDFLVPGLLGMSLMGGGIWGVGFVTVDLRMRKLLKRGSFTSVADLETKVLAFIDYYNRTMAKPFKWTYQGKVLTI